MSVEVQFAVNPACRLSEADIGDWAEAVMSRMGDAPGHTEVCVRVVDEQESQALNARYRRVDKPTNVLSFPAEVALPGSSEKILGDIVICDPVVEREAAAQRKVPREHYAHMVVHGMLHLYGFDHIEPAEADAMEDIEREVLGRMGIADPYRAA